ncbi:MAG: glycosyltransferase family 2 protein [Pseudomonadota bacterium]
MVDPHASPTKDAPDISVVAPVFNEAENVGPLIAEIEAALAEQGGYEVLIVDDCSTDATSDALAREKAARPRLRVLRHEANAGQSRALRTGVLAARGRIIVTLDGDGQNDPADIPRLLAQLTRPDAPSDLAMVAGQRIGRQDRAAKRWASKAANAVRIRMLGDGARDSGCGLKAFRRSAFLRAPYFDHLHRYLPAMMIREGFRVEYCDVRHRPRRFGVSKYTNWQRALVAVRDLLGVLWLTARARSPGRIREL